jgi:hypothetical protein
VVHEYPFVGCGDVSGGQVGEWGEAGANLIGDESKKYIVKIACDWD